MKDNMKYSVNNNTNDDDSTESLVICNSEEP